MGGGGATVPDNNHLDGLRGTRAAVLRSCVNVEVAVLGSLVPNSPYALCGRKATPNL